MELQNKLREGMTFDQLKEIGVYTNRNTTFPNLVQFSYDMIEAPKTHPIVMESRGIILDENDDWAVVAFPFTRFFNYGENNAEDAIDWKTAWVQEKVDGSLIILYHYGLMWHVATRGSCDAAGSVGDWTHEVKGVEIPWTFRDLFWSSAEYWKKGLCKSGDLNTQYTYMFELTSPFNRVVCNYTKIGEIPVARYNEETAQYEQCGTIESDVTGYGCDGSRITLIGVRDNVTERELPLDEFRDDFHYVVKEFPMTSFDEVLRSAAELDPMKQEGYVVVDGNFNRVKIKSPKYVLIHHLRDGFSERRLVNLVRMNEQGEFLTYYPEFKEKFHAYEEKYKNLLEQMETDWNHVNFYFGPNASQKEFALAALKTKVPSYLFSRRRELVQSPTEFLKDMNVLKLMELL